MEDIVIKTTDLTKRYKKFTAVNNLNISVPKGSVYGFIGNNGAGKTTTIRMLLGLLNPTSGSADVLGMDPRVSDIAVRKRTGYMPERQQLYRWMTVGEIIKFVGSFYPDWNEKTVKRYLTKYKLDANKKIQHLSKGMYAKLMFILCISHDPELLVLDEPSFGLDALVRREFLETLVEYIEEGKNTVFISSHLLDEVERVADYIGIIVNGVLTVEDKKDRILESVKKISVARDETPSDKEEARVKEIFNTLRKETHGRQTLYTVTGFSEEQLKKAQALGIKISEVINLNLEDIFIEYNIGLEPPE